MNLQDGKPKANLRPQSIITDLNVYFPKLDGGTYVKAKLQSIRNFFNLEEIAAVWDFFLVLLSVFVCQQSRWVRKCIVCFKTLIPKCLKPNNTSHKKYVYNVCLMFIGKCGKNCEYH